eukprot:2399077-Prymnesium_polylepis.1
MPHVWWECEGRGVRVVAGGGARRVQRKRWDGVRCAARRARRPPRFGGQSSAAPGCELSRAKPASGEVRQRPSVSASRRGGSWRARGPRCGWRRTRGAPRAPAPSAAPPWASPSRRRPCHLTAGACGGVGGGDR